ncbi:MAG: hypothetical protein HXX11_19570 [Desulfuromonadales bacterium]|nr:hypothetical protein [Desulfuromonadales bacterium]
MDNTAKIPVSLWAVIQRINRILAMENKLLLESSGHQEKEDFGDWYIIDPLTKAVTVRNCEIEELARKVGALKPNETI